MEDKTNEEEYEGERQQKQSLQWVFRKGESHLLLMPMTIARSDPGL